MALERSDNLQHVVSRADVNATKWYAEETRRMCGLGELYPEL
jgi:hypothetical protein